MRIFSPLFSMCSPFLLKIFNSLIKYGVWSIFFIYTSCTSYLLPQGLFVHKKIFVAQSFLSAFEPLVSWIFYWVLCVFWGYLLWVHLLVALYVFLLSQFLYSANANLARVLQMHFWSNLVSDADKAVYLVSTSTALFFHLYIFLKPVTFFASISVFFLLSMVTWAGTYHKSIFTSIEQSSSIIMTMF